MLNDLIGSWTGETQTWFDPSSDAQYGRYSGEFRSTLDGKVVEHRYESAIGEQAHAGVELWTFDSHNQRWISVWADTFHTPNDVMRFVGTGESPTVTGSYAAPTGPDWGWEVSVSVNGSELLIEHTNIEPDGTRHRAIRTTARRA